MSIESQTLSDADYRLAATQLEGLLGVEANQARSLAVQEKDRLFRGHQLAVEAIDADDLETQREHRHFPIDLREARLDDLADSIINGHQTEVSALEPNMCYPDERPAGHRMAAHLMSLLGRVQARRTRAPLDITSIMESYGEKDYSEYVMSLSGLLRHQGVTAAFSQVPLERVDALLKKLNSSLHGRVVNERGVSFFEPEPHLLGEQHYTWLNASRRGMPHVGIILQYPTGESAPAAQLASRLAIQSKDSPTAKLALASTSANGEAVLWQANTLLRAADDGSGDPHPQHHAIRYNQFGLSSNVAMYALAKALRTEVQVCLDALDRYRDSGTDQGWVLPYAKHNYGEDVQGKSEWDILPDDVDLIRFLVENLPKHIAPRSVRSYRNIGRGPYSYLDAVFEPFMRPNGTMRLQDPSSEAREFSQEWKDGTLAPEFAAIGPKYELLAVAAGGVAHGHLWRGSDKRARNLAVVEPGSLSSLEGRHQIEVESFVSCSTARKVSDFRKAIRARARSLEGGRTALMGGLHMLGSRNWGKYASVPLTEQDVLAAYGRRGADLEILDYYVTENVVKARAGYKAMMAVLARPRR